MKKYVSIMVVMVLAVGTFVGCSSAPTDPQQIEAQAPSARVLVNISGKVVEVDGDCIKLDNGKWVIIDENTVFADDPDNGSEPVNSEMVVGNIIQGYTSDDTSKETVTAVNIYTNVSANPQHVGAQAPNAKVLVNISGKIVEIDGNNIKLDNGKWVIIDENTVFADDPDNGSEPVSSEMAVGNIIQGYTSDDTSKETVTADQIYTNIHR